MVKVLCYGQVTEYKDRAEAIKKLKECMACSEGSELERYTNILCDLLWTSKSFVYDYEDEYEMYLKSKKEALK